MQVFYSKDAFGIKDAKNQVVDAAVMVDAMGTSGKNAVSKAMEIATAQSELLWDWV